MIIRDLVITGLCKLLRNVTVQNLVAEAINEVTKDEISNLSGLTSNVQSQLQQTQAAISTAQMEQNAWKSQISDAINNIPRNPNGDLASTASLDGFLHEIGEIEHGPDVSGVTATPNDIMADRKYVDTNWELKNGTMVRRGTPTPCIEISPSSNSTNTFIKIPKGGYMEGNTDYNEILVPNSDLHNHMGLTAAKILVGQAINYIQGTATSDANAEARHILKDKTAYVKGVKVTGSMTNYSGQTVNYAGYETIKIGLEPKDPNSQVQISFENKGKLTGYFDGTTIFKGNMYLPMDKVAYGEKIGRFKDFQTSGDTYLTGSYTGDATATNNFIVEGYTAYAKGNKLTGIIPNRGKKGSKGKHGMVALTASGSWADINVSKNASWGGYHIATNSDGVRRFCLQVPGGVYGGDPSDVSQAWLDAIGGDGYVGIELSKFGNAKRNQVLEGTTFTSNDCLDGQNIGITGTMYNFDKTPEVTLTDGTKVNYSMGIKKINDAKFKSGNDCIALCGKYGYYGANTFIGVPASDVLNRLGVGNIAEYILTLNNHTESDVAISLDYVNPEFTDYAIATSEQIDVLLTLSYPGPVLMIDRLSVRGSIDNIKLDNNVYAVIDHDFTIVISNLHISAFYIGNLSGGTSSFRELELTTPGIIEYNNYTRGTTTISYRFEKSPLYKTAYRIYGGCLTIKLESPSGSTIRFDSVQYPNTIKAYILKK